MNDTHEIYAKFAEANRESYNVIHDMLWEIFQQKVRDNKAPDEMYRLHAEVDAGWRQLLIPCVDYVCRKQFLDHELRMATVSSDPALKESTLRYYDRSRQSQ